jgi:hypothetical protein
MKKLSKRDLDRLSKVKFVQGGKVVLTFKKNDKDAGEVSWEKEVEHEFFFSLHDYDDHTAKWQKQVAEVSFFCGWDAQNLGRVLHEVRSIRLLIHGESPSEKAKNITSQTLEITLKNDFNFEYRSTSVCAGSFHYSLEARPEAHKFAAVA